MRAARWVGGALLAVVLLVAAALFFGPAYVASRQSERLLAAAGAALGREVRAERLGLTIIPAIGVTLSGVRVAEDPALGKDEPFLTAREVELRLQLLPLLRRRLVVERIVVEEPVVQLVRLRNGRQNTDSLGRPGGAGAARTGSTTGAAVEPVSTAGAGGAAPVLPPTFQLAMLRLRHGTIRYRDEASGRALELADVALDARQPRFGAPIPTSLRARLSGGDLRLDDITGEGTIDLGDGTAPGFRGTVDGGPGMLGTLPLTRLHAQVDARPPVLVLDDARLELLGGAMTGRTRLVSAGEGSGFTTQVAGQGLDLAALPAPPDRPRPAGRLELQGDATGPPPGSPGFQRALAGRGRFAVADGRLTGIPLGGALRDLLGPLLGEDRAGRLRQRYPELFGGDELRFTRLAGSGVLGDGRIRSDDLTLAAPSYTARGAGSLGLDGTVDVSITLTASSALTEDLLGNTPARNVLADASGLFSVPLRVRGPLQHPRVTPDPQFATNVARSLLGSRGLQGAEGLLERFLGGKPSSGRRR